MAAVDFSSSEASRDVICESQDMTCTKWRRVAVYSRELQNTLSLCPSHC